MSNNKIIGVLLIILIILSTISVIGCAFVGTRVNSFSPFFFVTDSNSLLAILVGIFAFMFFKNLNIPQIKIINVVAGSTFGVLLIHANCDAMRRWLWKDLFDNAIHYYDKYFYLYAIGCVVTVFFVCILIDIVRKNLLEKPLFNFLENKWEFVEKGIERLANKILGVLHIN